MIVGYLDASAWIKRYLQERGTNRIQHWFAQTPTIASASLGLVEVLATFARKHQAGELSLGASREKAREAVRDFEGFIQIHFTAETLAVARLLPEQYALRGADTVHLASALLLRRHVAEEADQLPFITSDQELAQAAREAGFSVRLLHN